MAREIIEDKMEAEVIALKAENEILKGCVMELADVVYGTANSNNDSTVGE